MNRIKEIIAAMNRRREDLWIEDDKTEFAELIVRECVSIVEDAVNHREPASAYVDKIKHHFGVK
jgi:hypothetical protein